MTVSTEPSDPTMESKKKPMNGIKKFFKAMSKGKSFAFRTKFLLDFIFGPSNCLKNINKHLETG